MQQLIQSIKHPIQATIRLPGSENLAYHAILLASLANSVSVISGLPLNDNVRTLLTALGQLGIAIQLDERNQSCIIAGGSGQFPKKQSTLWCGDSESVVHFLLTACAATPGVYYFDGSIHLRENNLSDLLTILSRQGSQAIPSNANRLPLTLIGCEATEGGDILLNHSLSHETISALLMMAPFANSPITFTLSNAGHQTFIDTTCAMMAEFGVLMLQIHQGKFMIPVPQRYAAKDITIEPDFSLASYFFAAAAITGGEITIADANRSTSKQSDVKMLSTLEKMGCRVSQSSTGLTLKGSQTLQGIDINLRQFSDAFFALASIAPFAKSPVRITHIGPLNHKESEHLRLIKHEWQKMRIHVETGENWIKIYPSNPTGTHINALQDHRLAMACAMMGLRSGGIIIDNAEVIARLHPDFFSLWQTLLIKNSSNA